MAQNCYLYLHHTSKKVSLLTCLMYFYIIFFFLHHYPVLTLQFPTILMSHHLPTPSSNSEMLAPITTSLDDLPFFFQVSHLKSLVHRTIISFFLSFHPSDPPSSSSTSASSPIVSLLQLPMQVPAPYYFPASTGQSIETCCKQQSKQTRNGSLKQERSRKLSHRPGDKGLKEDVTSWEVGLQGARRTLRVYRGRIGKEEGSSRGTCIRFDGKGGKKTTHKKVGR